MALRSRRLRRLIVTTGAIALSLYVSLAVFAYFCSDRLLFHPRPARYQDGPEIAKIPVAHGACISARYLPNPGATFTVLCSHGTSNDLGSDAKALEVLRNHGFCVLGYDYRCYGTSGSTCTGRPSGASACEDAEAAYRYLVETLHVRPETIIVMGQSLGGGPAAYLASRHPIAGLILESTFTSVFRVGTRVRLLQFDKFSNIDCIRQVRCPVLVMHGTEDEMIAFWHGQRLFEAANEPKLCLWVKGAGHEDLIAVAGSSYWDSLAAFTQMIETSRHVSIASR